MIAHCSLAPSGRSTSSPAQIAPNRNERYRRREPGIGNAKEPAASPFAKELAQLPPAARLPPREGVGGDNRDELDDGRGLCVGRRTDGRPLVLERDDLALRRAGLARISIGRMVCRPLERRGLRGRGRQRRHADGVPREWSNGAGPRIAAYAEYDAVPGNCQAAATRKQPRAGLSPHAGGHTDPHSALGISALGGALAAKAVMAALGAEGHDRASSASRPRSCGCPSRCMRPRAITTSSTPRSASIRPICCRWSIRRAGTPIAAPAMPASTASNAPSRKAG